MSIVPGRADETFTVVEAIRKRVRGWAASGDVDVILTTGGTGFTGRDVTSEELDPLVDQRIEGFAIVFHLVSYQSVGLSTLQSGATAGLIAPAAQAGKMVDAVSLEREGR